VRGKAREVDPVDVAECYRVVGVCYIVARAGPNGIDHGGMVTDESVTTPPKPD
jgi:hypothetical protein